MFLIENLRVALLVCLMGMLTVHALPRDETEVDAAAVRPQIGVAGMVNDMPSTTEAPADDKNTTTTTQSTTTSTTTTTTPDTTTTPANTTTSTTPATTSTTTTTTTTTPSPNTTTTTTTAPTPAPEPTPVPTTSTVAPSTTPAPTPVPHCNRFDPFSFVGGMILAYGSLAIMLVLYKFYKTRTEGAGSLTNPNNYRTL